GTTRAASRTVGHLAHIASLKTLIRLPNLAARIRKGRGQAGLDPHSRCGRRRTGYRLCLRNYFNRVNRRVFDLARENNAKLSVGHFHRHRLDIGAVGTARLRPNVEVLKFMALDIERKDALAGAGNTFVGLRKVELREILAIGNLAGKSAHAPMLAQEQARILGSGDYRRRTTAAPAGTTKATPRTARTTPGTTGTTAERGKLLPCRGQVLLDTRTQLHKGEPSTLIAVPPLE